MKHAVVVICSLLFMVGCVNLDAPPDLTRYFLMEGPDLSDTQGGFAVEVKSVELEPYLASPRMVVRLSNHEVRFSDIHRWAEPLDENIQSVLNRYLAVSHIGTISNRPAGQTRLFVRLHVYRFEGLDSDGATLAASWSVEDAAGQTLAKRRSNITVSGWDGADYDLLTQLLESTVSSLADEIAGAL